jgi:hypothetical protein
MKDHVMPIGGNSEKRSNSFIFKYLKGWNTLPPFIFNNLQGRSLFSTSFAVKMSLRSLNLTLLCGQQIEKLRGAGSAPIFAIEP